jgi:hypothetical protein
MVMKYVSAGHVEVMQVEIVCIMSAGLYKSQAPARRGE